jgi:hypothetical protein
LQEAAGSPSAGREGGFLGFFDGASAVGGHVAFGNTHANFFQEGSRRFASGLLRTVNSYDDGVRPEFDGIGIEEGFEFALANELVWSKNSNELK